MQKLCRRGNIRKTMNWTNRNRSLRQFAILAVTICLALVIGLLFLDTGTWLPAPAIERQHLGQPEVASQEHGAAVSASPIESSASPVDVLRSSPLVQCKVLVCTVREKNSELVVFAEHDAQINEAGVLAGIPPHALYASLPGLHVICLRPASAPALLQWSVDVLHVPAREASAVARIKVVDEQGHPVGGVRIAAAPVGRFVMKNDGYLWSALSGDDGSLDIAGLPVSPNIALRIVSGVVGEPSSRANDVKSSAESGHESEVHRQRLQVLLGRKFRVKVQRNDDYNIDLYVKAEFDSGRSEYWRGPLHIVDDNVEVVIGEGYRRLRFGLYDPLLGYPSSLAAIDDLEAMLANSSILPLEIPERSELKICARGPSGPCIMYAVEAWDVSARWNSKGARLLGDYPDGCLVIHGVLPGHRGLNVIPLDIGVARSNDHVFTIIDRHHLLEVNLESSRHVVVHVVSEDGKPIVGAQVTALSYPIDAKAAFHRRYAKSDADRRSGAADREAPYRMDISKTDSEGVVAMRVDGDSFTLLVDANGFVSAFVGGIHWPWQTIDVVMSSGGSIKFVGEWGRIEGFGLHLKPMDSPRPTREVPLAAGAKEVMVKGLCPGDWAVSLHRTGVDFMDLGVVRVVRNEEAKVVIPTESTGIRTVRGVALDSAGRPLGKALMRWWSSGRWNPAGDTLSCVTEVDGSFTVDLPAAVGMEAQIQSFHEASDSFVRLYALPIEQSVEDAGAMAFHALHFGVMLLHDGEPLADAAVDLAGDWIPAFQMKADSAGFMHLTNDGWLPPFGLRVSVQGVGSAIVDPLRVVIKGLKTLELR
jgi:hypothetical protein